MSLLASLRSLSPMAKRLVFMRLAIYLGMQCAYFIGVVGTLTYAFDGGVTENALGIVLGSFVGGPLLDRVGPRRFFSAVVAALVLTSLVYQLLAQSVAGVLVGAALLGGSWGLGDLVAKSFPAYLTDDANELKTINSVVFTVSNAAVIVGPLMGGFVSSVASPQAVFWLLGICSLVALVPAAGFRPARDPRAAAVGPEGVPESGTFPRPAALLSQNRGCSRGAGVRERGSPAIPGRPACFCAEPPGFPDAPAATMRGSDFLARRTPRPTS